MKPILCIALAAIILLAACGKKEQLPGATSTGANTFGCFVNGSAAKTEVHSGLLVAGGVSFTRSPGYTTVQAITLYPERRFYIGFADSQTGVRVQAEVLVDFSGEDLPYCVTDSSHRVYVTLSRLNGQVVAGSFEGTMVRDSTGESVSVTDGRFDVGK